MVHTSPQFTPAQLLESGRRAELEGNLDVAGQFYRHLTDHYAQTLEAAEARSGLGRIGAAQNAVWHANGTMHMNGGTHPAETGYRAGAARASRRRPFAPRDHYRTGRALAVLFAALGWLMVAAGLAGPVLILAQGGWIAPLAMWPMIGGAVGLSAIGLFVVFMGQAARALFDQANATRELVALERAKIGSD